MQSRLCPGAGFLALLVGLTFASPPAHALDQDDLDTLSRLGEASTEAFAKFGEIGETLTRISSSKFGGTGSQSREMSRRVDAAMQPWRNASASAQASLSYKVLPGAFTVADEGMSMLASYVEGDYRGMVGTAVSVGVEPTAVGTGASVFGAIGAGAGMVVGSFIPVVGNALGGVVGGAIGTVAGGYVSSYAYDKYVKELVTRAVEGGIAAVFDDKLHEAMRAKQSFMHQNAPPEVKAEWDRMLAVGGTFGGGEVQVLDWERLPYIIERKPAGPPSDATAPAPEQQAALPPSDFAGITSFELNQNDQVRYPLVCTVKGVQVSCFGRHSQGPGMTLTISITGTLSGNVIEAQSFTVFEATTGCTPRAEYRGRETITLHSGGRAEVSGSMTARQTVLGPPCKGPETWGGDFQAVGSWRPR